MTKNKFKAEGAPPKAEIEIPDNSIEGYPIYPPSDDIYSRLKNEHDIDPEQITKKKAPNEQKNELDFEEDVSGGDLDVPGTELDDVQEEVGSEDEENNYYSIGGDMNND